jgi:hypothetical protein
MPREPTPALRGNDPRAGKIAPLPHSFTPSNVFISNPGCVLYSYPLNLPIFFLHRRLTARRSTTPERLRNLVPLASLAIGAPTPL